MRIQYLLLCCLLPAMAGGTPIISGRFWQVIGDIGSYSITIRTPAYEITSNWELAGLASAPVVQPYQWAPFDFSGTVTPTVGFASLQFYGQPALTIPNHVVSFTLQIAGAMTTPDVTCWGCGQSGVPIYRSAVYGPTAFTVTGTVTVRDTNTNQIYFSDTLTGAGTVVAEALSGPRGPDIWAATTYTFATPEPGAAASTLLGLSVVGAFYSLRLLNRR